MCCPFYVHFFRNRIEHLFVLWYNILVQSKRKWMQISDYSPLVHKEGDAHGHNGSINFSTCHLCYLSILR